jgi:hypothetical protein
MLAVDPLARLELCRIDLIPFAEGTFPKVIEIVIVIVLIGMREGGGHERTAFPGRRQGPEGFSQSCGVLRMIHPRLTAASIAPRTLAYGTPSSAASES